MRNMYTQEQIKELAKLLAESYNKSNHLFDKSLRNEIRHTLRAVGYTIEELPDKTTRAVK